MEAQSQGSSVESELVSCSRVPVAAVAEGEAAARPPHHEQAELCRARAAYRQGRKLTAVKVYSVCAESPHLLVYGAPALRLRRELRALLTRDAGPGQLVSLAARADPAAAPFTDTYHARYGDVRPARAAKLRHDARNWYGGSLHVCYAPELESVAETRDKLRLRRGQVAARLRLLRCAADAPTHTHAHSVAAVATHAEEPVGAVAVNRKRPRPLTNTILLEKQYRPCFLPSDTAATDRPIGPLRDHTRVNTAPKVIGPTMDDTRVNTAPRVIGATDDDTRVNTAPRVIGATDDDTRVNTAPRGIGATEDDTRVNTAPRGIGATEDTAVKLAPGGSGGGVRVCAVPPAPLNRIKFTLRKPK